MSAGTICRPILVADRSGRWSKARSPAELLLHPVPSVHGRVRATVAKFSQSGDAGYNGSHCAASTCAPVRLGHFVESPLVCVLGVSRIGRAHAVRVPPLQHDPTASAKAAAILRHRSRRANRADYAEFDNAPIWPAYRARGAGWRDRLGAEVDDPGLPTAIVKLEGGPARHLV